MSLRAACVRLMPIACAVAAASPSSALASQTDAVPQNREALASALPDTPGSGPFPAVKEMDDTLPDHVIYRPSDLSAAAARKLPIVVWGNGGCAGDGAGQRFHLLELASHGYLVIANGTIASGPGAKPLPPRAVPPPGPDGAFVPPPPQTFATQLTDGIDWAVRENKRRGSRYFGKLDPAAIAVSGWSCGGVQALTVGSRDPRVKTIVIHNSGLFPPHAPKRPEMALDKAALARICVPIIYILGGTTDIAYANGSDDFARLSGVPAAKVSLNVGHQGTFFEPNGGRAAVIARTWLDWRLKNSARARAMFAGSDCTLCTDPAVEYLHKD
ncbi:hypothetical protein [Sphingomonas sp.]|uniref:hypothetical protein n=1 Tax=Sphingomonas sp. TaxID=28214 RepID=UPI0035C7CC43